MGKYSRYSVLGMALLPMFSMAEDLKSFVPKDVPAGISNAIEKGKPITAFVRSMQASQAVAEKNALSALGVDVGEINRPWEIFLQALAAKFKVTGDKYIQFVTAPQPADWSDKTYGAYRTSYYGDAIPKWGATFSPQTASSFADVYGTFINSIQLKLPNPADQARADQARSKWNICDTALQNRYKLIGKHWKDFSDSQAGLPDGKKLTYDAWFSRFEAPSLKTYQDKCNLLAIDYNKWFNSATQGQANLANAILRYSNAKQVSAQIPGTDGQYESVWPYSFVQSLDDFVSTADQAPNLAFDQTFTKASGTYSATESHWGGSASYGWFFRGSAGGSSSAVDTHNDAFSMTIQLKGLQVFDVRPGDWFSQALIQAWKDGPFEPNSIINAKYKSGTLYGQDGFFALRSARYIVAYQPKIVLGMSNSNYHESKSSWSAGGGLSIGPFSFGASGGGSSTNITWDDAKNTVTIADSSKVPQVIGVILDVLPEFK